MIGRAQPACSGELSMAENEKTEPRWRIVIANATPATPVGGDEIEHRKADV